ncbi:MAG: CPXCG motif-containing cysteine-rich protein [Idiomarina sp.]|nr:CPXCG motif-containing cysteine-rich protein [Idiomarina sp.]
MIENIRKSDLDCQICCQPIELMVVEVGDGEFEVHARTDDE